MSLSCKKNNSEIECLADVLDFTNSLEGDYWFRGHSKLNYKLLPSVLRPTPDEKYYDESKLLSEFIRRHPEANEKHTNILEVLTYAQHYGLPTRMLDWTENLLIALYFVCEDKNNIKDDGKLFYLKVNPAKYDAFSEIISDLSFWETVVTAQYYGNDFSFLHLKEKIVNNIIELINNDKLGMYKECCYFDDSRLQDVIDMINSKGHGYINNVSPLNFKISVGKSFNSLLSDSIYLYSPPMINKRLINQSGCFTIHTGKLVGGKQLIPVEDAAISHSEFISSLIIPNEAKPRILKELRKCGIHSSSVFPELEYLTNDIKSYCVF